MPMDLPIVLRRSIAPIAMACVAMVVGSSPMAVGHPDDPKILDKLPRHEGPGWSAARPEEGRAEGVVENASQLGFQAQGVQLQSWVSLPDFGAFQSGNDCWGYVSPSGREYAIMGLNSATAFVEVTDPANPVIVSVRPGPDSLWRDVKTYQQYAYSVSEGGGGIQVFDLSNIDDGVVTLSNTILTGGTDATHNVAINEESGYLYRCGGGSNGLRIYRLNLFPEGPANPVFVGSWPTKYVHDVQVVTYTEGPLAGREIAFCCSGFNGGFVETGLTILDVTNKSNIQVLGELQYPAGAYSHQGWLTEDKEFFLLNDELDEQTFGTPSRTHIIDVSDLTNPTYTGFFTNGNAAVTHNMYIKGDLMFASNYRSGLRVFDISNLPEEAEEIAFFDTFPGSDSASFNGLWSNYPYFPSGTVIGSDLERGLFVWTIEEPPFDLALAGDAPALISPGGATVEFQIEPKAGEAIAPGSAVLRYSVDGGAFASVPLVGSGPVFSATFPPLACESVVAWFIEVESASGTVQTLPLAGATDAFVSVAASGRSTLFFDDMNGLITTWAAGLPSDNATSGQWVRVDPNPTGAQPGQCVSPPLCWITGQGSVGGPLGEADVDNGVTTLTTPMMNAVPEDPAAGDAYLSYYRWYSNDQGANPGVDSMPVLISNDGGASWVQLELVTENANAWVRREYRIADFITPTAEMRVRFIARDLNPQALVEAGVDDVEIFFYICETPPALAGDLDGSCIVDSADLGVLLGAFGSSGAGDLNGDGITNTEDLGILLGQFGATCDG